MKITLEQLTKQLAKPLAPIYLLSGDEPLLLQEAQEKIQQCAVTQGFTDKQILDAQEAENIGAFPSACFNRSLLNEKTLLIARFSPSKPEQHPWQSIFHRFAHQPPSDKRLIILLGKLNAAQLKSAWLQKLAAQTIWLHIPALPIKYFISHLQQRLTQQGFTITPDALQLFNDYVEGNLLAAQQCITKLQLLYTPPLQLTEKLLLPLIAPSTRYTVFDLINAITARQLSKITIILNTLAADGTEPAIILWALARECRRQQQPLWIKKLFHLDQIIKGLAPHSTDIWTAFTQVSFMMAGKNLL